MSTADQHLRMQIDALVEYGVPEEGIFQERESGRRDDRPQLSALLEAAREGDTVVVWKLDRLGRSLGHLVGLVAQMGERGVNLVSLRDSIDTTSAAGRLTFHVMASLAEFEADMTRERTAAGLAAAKRRGVRLGRPGTDPERMAHAISLHVDQGLPASEVRRLTGVAESTLYQHMRKQGRGEG